MMGQGKQAAVDKGVVKQETADKVAPVSSSEFPIAPKEEPIAAPVVPTESFPQAGAVEEPVPI